MWTRHVPHGADLFGRADTPSDGRWQRGDIVRALYLADTVATATAEWYRSLAEWGLSPQDHIPYDHHRWRLDLELADLSDVEQLRRVSLEAPDRAEAHGLPIKGLVSSSGARDGPAS
jgi:RES domain-containing protein